MTGSKHMPGTDQGAGTPSGLLPKFTGRTPGIAGVLKESPVIGIEDRSTFVRGVSRIVPRLEVGWRCSLRFEAGKDAYWIFSTLQ